MKKMFIIIAALLSMCAANAENFYVDSIEYSLAYPADSVVAVSRCLQMTGDVVIPETVPYHGRTYRVNCIKEGAFMGDYGGWLHSISLPNTLRYIEAHNFSNYRHLTNINIPNTVEVIDQYCFNNCSGLRSVDLHTIEISGESFNHCPDLEKVTIANTVTVISPDCFSYDSALTEIVIGDECRRIYWDCFKCCPAVKKITIGASLQIVDEGCFMCVANSPNPQYAQVDTVVVHGSNPQCYPFYEYNSSAYGIDYHTTILVVPCNTRSIYEQAYGWNQFYNIVEDCSTNSINAVEHGCDINVFSHDGRIVMHSENNACGVVCDIEGRVVETICDGTPSNPLPNGVYLVRVGTLPARKVVVIR